MQAQTVDFIIIGGGVAGLTAAQYAARSNLKTLVIEKASHGGQALAIDKIENYPGISTPIDGFAFSDEMKKQAQNFGASFSTDVVTLIDKKGSQFVVTGTNKQYYADAVLLATGAKHKKLGVLGEEEFAGRGVSYCATCDGAFFKGKRVFVVGGGDAACDDALYLSKLGCAVTIVHRRDSFRAQKVLAERTLAAPNVTVLFNCKVKQISEEQVDKTIPYVKNAVNSISIENILSGEVTTYPTNAVFILIGMTPEIELANAVKKDEASHIITNEKMETSLPGLFCAGDVRSKPFRQLITAASDGAIAAYAASLYIDALHGTTHSVQKLPQNTES